MTTTSRNGVLLDDCYYFNDEMDKPATTTPSRPRKVPKGTSSYQAAWILVSDIGSQTLGWNITMKTWIWPSMTQRPAWRRRGKFGTTRNRRSWHRIRQPCKVRDLPRPYAGAGTPANRWIPQAPGDRVNRKSGIPWRDRASSKCTHPRASWPIWRIKIPHPEKCIPFLQFYSDK